MPVMNFQEAARLSRLNIARFKRIFSGSPTEHRSARPAQQIERRSGGTATADADPGSIRGVAVTWGRLSADLGGWRERIARGAFTESIESDQDIAAFVSHDAARLLGRKANGTLAVEETAKGLEFTCSLPRTSYAADLRALVERGDVLECSFGFTCDASTWSVEKDENGERVDVRTVTSARLWEISPCLYGAYGAGTSVGVLRAAMFPDGVPAELRSRLSSPIAQPVDPEETQEREIAEMCARALLIETEL